MISITYQTNLEFLSELFPVADDVRGNVGDNIFGRINAGAGCQITQVRGGSPQTHLTDQGPRHRSC